MHRAKNKNGLQLWSVWWPSSLQLNYEPKGKKKNLQVLCPDDASRRTWGNDKLDSVRDVFEI